MGPLLILGLLIHLTNQLRWAINQFRWGDLVLPSDHYFQSSL